MGGLIASRQPLVWGPAGSLGPDDRVACPLGQAAASGTSPTSVCQAWDQCLFGF